MKLVVVIDGDLLVTEYPDQGMQGQKDAISQIVGRLGVLLDNGHELVIVHGNAPQVGYMLLRGEAARPRRTFTAAGHLWRGHTRGYRVYAPAGDFKLALPA